jgi:hypothetical protein
MHRYLHTSVFIFAPYPPIPITHFPILPILFLALFGTFQLHAMFFPNTNVGAPDLAFPDQNPPRTLQQLLLVLEFV